MSQELSLFVGTFTTLLAIINPLEVLPIYLKIVSGRDAAARRLLAWKACLYALLLAFFFLVFGNLMLRLFDVPLSMVRIVGGIILVKIGFELFSPTPDQNVISADGSMDLDKVAFVPLAMPLMFGPGAIATILGMTATIKNSTAEIGALAAVSAAIVATMFATFLCLVNAEKLSRTLGPMGIDAATRIVGFFVSAMGVGLMFEGFIEALRSRGITSLH